MPKLVVDLCIEAQEYQRLYTGNASAVGCRSLDGRRVRFPARILLPYVTHDGIRGRFLIEFYDDNRFRSIERVQ